MPTRNVNLTDQLDRFIEASVADGRCQNASEVVREGLRLLEQRQREDALKLQRLQAAVWVGLADARQGRTMRLAAEAVEAHLAGLGRTGIRGV